MVDAFRICGFVAALMLAPLCAHAQTVVQPVSPPQSAPAAPPPPESPATPPANPGLIEELGNFWKRSTGLFPSPIETIETLNSSTKGATESLGKLARPSSVANGRVVCQIAPNGAPDCRAAAIKLCQSKGYNEGSSLETDAAESCPAKVMLSGRPAQPGDCRVDNFVTRALCQ